MFGKQGISTEKRLNNFPLVAKDLDKTVRILWNSYQVPYIYAETDHDAAYAMGMVHAHLRLTQIESFKRLVTGRLSEMFGPFTNNIDQTLRILGIARVADKALEIMPEETKAWVYSYVKGINHYKKSLNKKNTPPELKWLGIDPKEEWTAQDTIAVGRLFGIDVNWMAWLDLLGMRDQENFTRIWNYMHEVGGNGEVGFLIKGEPKTKPRHLSDLKKLKGLLWDTSRSGSNSIVIGKEKSATGGGLIANDPHVGLMMPNAWLMAAIKSPSYNIVGMMPPGVPIIGFGRTPDLAWGGTNMRALSTDMVDISTLDESTFEEETQTIKTRFWFNKKVTIRHSPFGPVMSDANIFPSEEGKTIAMRWVGHMATDEVTGFLKGARAKNWAEFSSAFDDFAVPAQNFLFVGKKGDIGYLLATQLPKRSQDHKNYLVHSMDMVTESWKEILHCSSLPMRYQPEEKFLASANNRPANTEYPIGYFFPQDERIRRIKQLVSEKNDWTIEDLKKLQRDAVSLTSYELKEVIAEKTKNYRTKWSRKAKRAINFLLDWDGSYSPNNKQAYFFTAFLIELGPLVYEIWDRPGDFDLFKNDAYFRDLLKRDIQAMDSEILSGAVRKALDAAYSYLEDNKTWGDIHRMQLTHFLAQIPVVKYLFKTYDYSHGGTRETIMKAAHPLTMEKHRAYYGAQSRQISDMSDIDANYFVLAGGQDGFIGSDNFVDQAALFEKSEYIQMPLSDKKIKELFPLETIISKK